MGSILNHCHTLAYGGTLGEIEQLQRYFSRDSFGPPCLKMCTNLCLPVTNAKEWGAYQNEMNRPCKPF